MTVDKMQICLQIEFNVYLEEIYNVQRCSLNTYTNYNGKFI